MDTGKDAHGQVMFKANSTLSQYALFVCVVCVCCVCVVCVYVLGVCDNVLIIYQYLLCKYLRLSRYLESSYVIMEKPFITSLHYGLIGSY